MKKHIWKIVLLIHSVSILFCLYKIETVPIWYYMYYLIGFVFNFILGRDNCRYAIAQDIDETDTPYKRPFTVKYFDFLFFANGVVCAFVTANYIADWLTLSWFLLLVTFDCALFYGQKAGSDESIVLVNELIDICNSKLTENENVFWERLKDEADGNLSEDISEYIIKKCFIDNKNYAIKTGKKNLYPVIYTMFEGSKQIVVFILDFETPCIFNTTDIDNVKAQTKSIVAELINDRKDKGVNIPFASDKNSLPLDENENYFLVKV